jgi:hypothetical protein
MLIITKKEGVNSTCSSKMYAAHRSMIYLNYKNQRIISLLFNEVMTVNTALKTTKNRFSTPYAHQLSWISFEIVKLV